MTLIEKIQCHVTLDGDCWEWRGCMNGPIPTMKHDGKVANVRRLHLEVEDYKVLHDSLMRQTCEQFGEIVGLKTRIEELEAQLYAVGAGGVGPLMPVTMQHQHNPCSINHLQGNTGDLVTSSSSVPAGWKLVPDEPTMSMQHAALIESRAHGPVSTGECNALPISYELGASVMIYRAMLDAAPQPPAPGCKATKRGDHVVCDDCKSAWDANEKNPPACVPAPPAVERPQQVEMLGETCIDGGKCHHKCTDRCFRRECCAPFSDYSGPWKYEQTQPQVEQKPVSWKWRYEDGELSDISFESRAECERRFAGYKGKSAPLYTHPHPPRQPLTRQQIQNIVMEVCDTIYPQDHTSYSEADSVFYGAFVNAIERAHGIGSRS